jgi:hypothetical protein
MREIQERPPFNAKNIDGAPLRGDAGDLGAPTIQCKKMSTVDPWKAVMEIRERPPSTQKMLMAGPWEAILEIWERPPFNAKSVNGIPPGR